MTDSIDVDAKIRLMLLKMMMMIIDLTIEDMVIDLIVERRNYCVLFVFWLLLCIMCSTAAFLCMNEPNAELRIIYEDKK